MKFLKFSIMLMALVAIVSCSKDDTTAPVITITSPVEGSVLEKGKTYPVTGTVTDETELSEIDAGGYKITSFDTKTSYAFANLNLPIPADTKETGGVLKITAKDKAGNVAVKSITFSIK
ncbi:MAG TPA: Ig-like domain-containing protein [Saprospiraceae bacterium]|nr:hypothetical protein [Saprospiraceae bacterium]HRO07610.1 Ig-like domain-containing protein [Saprospiraceae bacterium]HRO72046.1 Ig-like domain-containing protein [Saprospiraceae bacterium]HRP40893.1 Ig-like domain-containing protein [Saprospiraceae bacterium]